MNQTKYYLIPNTSLKEIMMDFCGLLNSIPQINTFVNSAILAVCYGEQTDKEELELVLDKFEQSVPVVYFEPCYFFERLKDLKKSKIEIHPELLKRKTANT